VLAIVGVGLAVALPEPELLVLGVAGAAAVVLTIIVPLAGLPLLLFAVPFGTIARGSSGDSSSDLSFGGAEVVVTLLALAWLARGVRLRRINLRPGAVVIGIVAMTSLAMLSIGYATDKSLAVKESLKWLELLVALVIVVDLASLPNGARWVMGAMFVAGSAEALYGAYQFFTDAGPDFFQVQGALRAFGHFEQPNPFAGYLTIILPLAVCMALCGANPLAFRLLSVAAAGALLVGIALSQSRGAWLGGLVAAVCLLLLWNRVTRQLLVPAALFAGLGTAMAFSGLLPASITDRLAQTIQYFGVFDVRTVEVTPDNWAIVERMAHWQAGWYMFLDHPWLGVGAGNYPDAYPAYYVGQWLEPLGHAHNYYLNILAELGVVGGALLLVLLGLAFRELVGAILHSEGEAGGFWRAVLAGSIGGLIVFCVHNLFDSLFVHSVNIQVGVLLGLGLIGADAVRRDGRLARL
jgi:putative inorganic carbon (hco3(-)) transporter